MRQPTTACACGNPALMTSNDLAIVEKGLPIFTATAHRSWRRVVMTTEHAQVVGPARSNRWIWYVSAPAFHAVSEDCKKPSLLLAGKQSW
jgi:hypothetical protein